MILFISKYKIINNFSFPIFQMNKLLGEHKILNLLNLTNQLKTKFLFIFSNINNSKNLGQNSK